MLFVQVLQWQSALNVSLINTIKKDNVYSNAQMVLMQILLINVSLVIVVVLLVLNQLQIV